MKKHLLMIIFLLFVFRFGDGESASYEKTFKSSKKSYVREIKETLLSECGSLVYPKESRISPDGRKFAWIADILGKRAIMINSEVTGVYEAAGSLFFSPNSKRFAHAKVADEKGALSFVIDGKETKKYDSILISSFQFSPDSNHYAFIAIEDKKYYAVIDGKEGDSYELIDSIVFSPDSKHIAYTAIDGNQWLWHVVFDGKIRAVHSLIIPESIGFSPDSKQFSYIAGDEIKKECFYVINWIPEKMYFASLDPVQFSPDSKRLAYGAVDGEEWFYVLDRKKQPTYRGIGKKFFFSPDSQHFAYIAGIKNGWCVVKDGNEGRAFFLIFPDSLKFSPNSQHFAYLGIESFKLSQIDLMRNLPFRFLFALVKDDKAEFRKNLIIPDSIVFSPDSTRMAFSEIDRLYQNRVIVDGKEHNTYDNYLTDPIYPVFTTDSRFIVYAGKKNGKWFVVVDGSESTEYDEILGPPQKKVYIDGPDSFHYLARKGNKVFLIEERIRSK